MAYCTKRCFSNFKINEKAVFNEINLPTCFHGEKAKDKIIKSSKLNYVLLWML